MRNKLYPVILTIGNNAFYGFIATADKTYLLEGVDNTGTITEERRTVTLADEDFIISQQRLSFEHGESSNFLTLKVIDDEEAENNESFNIKLVSENHTDITRVEIIDNDYIPIIAKNKSSSGGIYGIYLLCLTLLFLFVKTVFTNLHCQRSYNF